MAIEGFLSSPGCLALVWTVSVGALMISLHNALHHVSRVAHTMRTADTENRSTLEDHSSCPLQVKNYTKPSLQRYIVRIILVVPVYSLSSVLSLQFPVQVSFL